MTSSTLCDRCQNIFTGNQIDSAAQKAWKRPPIHHESASSFYRAVHSGCILCNRILNAFTRQLEDDLSTWDVEEGFSYWDLNSRAPSVARGSEAKSIASEWYGLSFGLARHAFWGPHPSDNVMSESEHEYIVIPREGTFSRLSVCA
jgi:hypothetical protein